MRYWNIEILKYWAIGVVRFWFDYIFEYLLIEILIYNKIEIFGDCCNYFTPVICLVIFNFCPIPIWTGAGLKKSPN